MLNNTNLYKDDIYKAPPRDWNFIQNQLNQWGDIELLEINLKNQYIDLKDLGINYLKEVTDIYEDICLNFLNYVNTNYISINYLDQIKNDNQKLQLYTKNIYELLFVDFIYIKDNFKLDNLKFDIISYYTKKINGLNKMKNIDTTINLTNDILKCTIAVDIFDTDLDNFIDNFYTVI
jgi:hypothetical protein